MGERSRRRDWGMTGTWIAHRNSYWQAVGVISLLPRCPVLDWEGNLFIFLFFILFFF